MLVGIWVLILIFLPFRINNKIILSVVCRVDADVKACIGITVSIRTGMDTQICIDANVRTDASTSIQILIGVSIDISILHEYYYCTVDINIGIRMAICSSTRKDLILVCTPACVTLLVFKICICMSIHVSVVDIHIMKGHLSIEDSIHMSIRIRNRIHIAMSTGQ